MKRRDESIAKDKRHGYRSRYLLLVLAIVMAFSAGAAGTAFAAQEEPEQPADGRIVGGDPVQDGKFSFVAALNIKQGGKTFFCGGSLIDASHVLTAAHCVVDNGAAVSAADVRVIVGRTVLSSNKGQERRASRVAVHPRFNGDTFAYDAAVLELNRPITNIQPIALAQPKTGANKPGSKATVAGYGASFEGANGVEDRLREAQVPLVSDKECAQDYENFMLPFKPKIELCAGKKGVDACQGDSGGPLFRAVNGKIRQIGIVSFGKGCARAKLPGVYTQITAEPILSFIQQATGKAAPAEVPAAA